MFRQKGISTIATVLLIILILLLVGGVPVFAPYGLPGVLVLALIIVLALALAGKL